MKVALITHAQSAVPAWVISALTEAGVTCVGDQCPNSGAIVRLAHDADVIWSYGTHHEHTPASWREVIEEALPDLKQCGAILRSGSGTDNIPLEAATRHNILVVNTPEATAEPVAEFAVGLMLAVGRQIVQNAVALRSKDDASKAPRPQRSLVGKMVGLVGFGHIAKLVANRLSGFRPQLLAFDPAIPASDMQAHGVESVPFDQLLEQSDYISLHCPLNDKTHHLINESALRKMQSSAILINTARGEIVDERALIEALDEGRIAGAGLDVTDPEPIDPGNPLLNMSNVVVTPHVAAFDEAIGQRLWQFSVEALADLAQFRWPRSYVNHVQPRWPLRERD
ncbi:C-terminal binding protein [Phycisphaerales bacterium AB-hyl4]|uniref:C-terminal binding protein n=1 Tax=Natronomicrosphaera hydrolytica TaxID=3242702 RepID=A0ABV4U3T7_9BACT